jgi:hypothetical protein
MKRFCSWLLFTLLAAAGTARGETRRVVFESAGAEHTWALKDVDPNLPADWSPFQFLVLELKLSSPQRFDLRIHDDAGVRSVRLSPVPGAWIRSAVPLSFLTEAARQGNDLASVHNKARAMMFINLSGTPGELRSVREIGVVMPNPIGGPSLEIRSVRLAHEDPGDALLDPKPLVDQFGQWMGDDWPGKATSLDQLRAAWAAEEKALASTALPECRYGGYEGTKAQATGFFRVEKIDGKWWFVDPDGHLFLSVGSDSIGTSAATVTQGREQLFAALPPADPASGRPRAASSPLIAPPAAPPPAASATARSGGRVGSSFYTWNMVRRFGADWSAKWIDLTVRRMFAWGFNTVGNWSDQRLGNAHRIPYVVTLRGWGIETGPMGVPDVYAPEYAANIDRAAAQQCEPHKDDPFVLGYFLGNEPPWPGRESVAVDAILAGPASSLQMALKAFLADGDTPERRKTFLFQTYGKFVEAATAAIRKHDPNHLNLGLRFGSSAPPEIVRLSKVFDVYSLNNYAYTVNKTEIEKVRSLIDRPILIGEFHFGTPGRGMTPGLKQTSSQEERGVAYRYYVENAMADPSIVGAHWFEWIDEPSTGRFDGENYNIGLVDVTDRPYRELIDAAQATHKRLANVDSGKEPAVTRQAKVQ